MIIDSEGRIEWVNPAFTRLTGYPATETVGQDWMRLCATDEAQPYPEGFAATLREGRVWQGEIARRRKDGTTYHEELSVTPVPDGEGRLARYVGIERDVSERRLLEAQLRQVTKMEAVGRLAAGVAHDFNNLLGVIRGSGELALRQIPPDAPGRDRVEGMLEAADRAAALTRQLLAFGRQQVMAPTVLDLNAVVGDVARLLRPLVGEDIRVQVEAEGSLGSVRADRTQIDQVLMNLAVNARDAMPGGGQLVLRTRNVELDQAFCRNHAGSRPGPYVAVEVEDTGTGIDRATLAHVFEPFFTTKGQGKGTGLGLATVYGIVKQSDGYVWVDSEPGRGTTVTALLPRVTADPPPASPAVEALGGKGNETLLLVEDEEALRALVAELLRESGYSVFAAGTRDEALAAARDHPEIALLLTDVVMPGTSGPQLASALRTIRPSMRVLYMSGYSQDAIARHGILEPGVLLLPKPFTSVQMASKVREALCTPLLAAAGCGYGA